MRGPDRAPGATTSCLTPERPALADTGGRVTMPFLPTLATVVLLATASLFCPNSQTPAPTAAARMIPASGPASLAMAEPALPLAEPAPRTPAIVAFSDVYPLTIALDPATTAAISAPIVATRLAARPSRRVATAAPGRRPCAGRRCQEAPAPDVPFSPAKPGLGLAGTAEATSAKPVPGALPFAESVAEAILPVAREVGADVGARVERVTGGAVDLMRDGRSVVTGAVSGVTDHLL
jgi:hypothetical protein